MPKKILILTPFYPPNIGGAETFTEGLVKEASKCNDVTVLTYQSFNGQGELFEDKSQLEGRLRIYRMKWLAPPSKVWSGVGFMNLFSAMPLMAVRSFFLLLKNRYQIVHAQGLISGLVAVLLKKVFKVKVFITLLALYEFKNWKGLKRNLVRWIFKNTDCLFVEGRNGFVDAAGIGFIPDTKEFNHWVDQEIFTPPYERPNDKIRVLFIGRPIPEKGMHIIKEAENYLTKPHRYEFTYVQNISYSDLPKYYQMAHIVVVPSLYAEGYSRVVAEAASCGCAVITSNRGSLPEMIDGWGTATEPTSEMFTYHIKKNNPDRSGQQAFDHALKNFSPKNSEVFLNEYSNC